MCAPCGFTSCQRHKGETNRAKTSSTVYPHTSHRIYANLSPRPPLPRGDPHPPTPSPKGRGGADSLKQDQDTARGSPVPPSPREGGKGVGRRGEGVRHDDRRSVSDRVNRTRSNRRAMAIARVPGAVGIPFAEHVQNTASDFQGRPPPSCRIGSPPARRCAGPCLPSPSGAPEALTRIWHASSFLTSGPLSPNASTTGITVCDSV